DAAAPLSDIAVLLHGPALDTPRRTGRRGPAAGRAGTAPPAAPSPRWAEERRRRRRAAGPAPDRRVPAWPGPLRGVRRAPTGRSPTTARRRRRGRCPTRDR